jgi:hypothetical protein
MACTAWLVCFISTVSGRSKKMKKCGASSTHKTKLEQSIFLIFMGCGYKLPSLAHQIRVTRLGEISQFWLLIEGKICFVVCILSVQKSFVENVLDLKIEL